jgi:hypothetical protein
MHLPRGPRNLLGEKLLTITEAGGASGLDHGATGEDKSEKQ